MNLSIKELNSPKVSIGIPCYNRPEGLRRTLESVVTQTYGNIEIVISDNASPNPKVEEVAREFAKKDNRIRYFRQAENRGMGFNFNFVLDKSMGEYFMWLCDDDWISANYIEECIKIITSQSEIAIVTGKVDTFKTMTICNNSPYIRIIRYFMNYRYVFWMVYGIMPKSEIRIRYLSLHGSDWIIVADMLYIGKLIVAEKAMLHYAAGGTSSQSTSYARAQNLNLTMGKAPLFSVAFAYMKHMLNADHPYEKVSLPVRLVFPVLVLVAMILARIKANTLHILKLLLPQATVDFLNKISGRKK